MTSTCEENGFVVVGSYNYNLCDAYPNVSLFVFLDDSTQRDVIPKSHQYFTRLTKNNTRQNITIYFQHYFPRNKPQNLLRDMLRCNTLMFRNYNSDHLKNLTLYIKHMPLDRILLPCLETLDMKMLTKQRIQVFLYDNSYKIINQ